MKYLLSAILFAFSFLNFYAQNEEKITIKTPKPLASQFDYIFEESGNYQDYKVIKQVWFQTLKKQTLDSVSLLEKEVKSAQETIKELHTKLQKSNTQVAALNEELTSISEEKDQMQLLGLTTSKNTFSTTLFSILGILIILLILFIYKFKSSHAVTNVAKSNLKDLEVEYEDYRRRALEREQKVMRKLQDELNKKK